jgi:hypothetical protein
MTTINLTKDNFDQTVEQTRWWWWISRPARLAGFSPPRSSKRRAVSGRGVRQGEY